MHTDTAAPSLIRILAVNHDPEPSTINHVPQAVNRKP